MARRELAFQNHIIDSYGFGGGYAKKWASEWQKGVPDLICSLPEQGMHLAEVKHVPNFGPNSDIQNPMTDKQRDTAKNFQAAGARVLLYVVAGEDTRKCVLYAFPSHMSRIFGRSPAWVPYRLGHKFDVNVLFNYYKDHFGMKLH